jgi:hypothetical protein
MIVAVSDCLHGDNRSEPIGSIDHPTGVLSDEISDSLGRFATVDTARSVYSNRHFSGTPNKHPSIIGEHFLEFLDIRIAQIIDDCCAADPVFEPS